MKKIFKLVAWIFIVVPVLVVALALIVPRFIDPNDYRQQITDIVRKQTGRKLAINGELAISLFPWVGVRVRDASLAQPSSVGDGDMLSVAEADIRVRVVPLFNSVIEIDTVILREPLMNLIVLPDGSSSMEGLIPAAVGTAGGSAEAGPPADAGESGVAAGAAGTAVAFAFHGIQLEQGRLVWDDQENEQRIEMYDLHVSAGELLGDVPGEFSITGTYDGGSSGGPLDFVLAGMASIDAESFDASITDMRLDAMQGDTRYEVTAGTTSWVQLVQQLEITGLQFNAGTDAGAFSVGAGALAADFARQTLSLPRVDVRLAGMELTASVAGTGIVDSPELTGSVNTNTFSAASVIESLGLDYKATGPGALNALSFSTGYTVTPERLALADLDVKLDDSRLTGSVGVDDYEAPAIEFDLVLDDIDIDRYLPVVEEGQEDLQQATAGAALILPVALFRGLNVNGDFKADRLVAGGLRVEAINVAITSSPGSVTVKPSAQLYGGTLRGTMQYVNTGTSERLHVSEVIEGVQLGDLLTDAGVTDRLTGTGSLNVDIEILNEGGVQQSSGVVRVLASDGALKGIDIKKIIDQAITVWTQMQGGEAGVQKAVSNDETRFAELSGTFNLADLQISNDDLEVKAPAFRVSGRGEIDLGAEELDYLVSVSIVDTSEGQGGAERSDLSGITIPVRITGALGDPGYRIDFEELIRAAAQYRVDEEREKFEQKLNEKLNEGLNKLFR